MQISIEAFTVNKRFPLTISRGTTAQTTNIWVKIAHDGIEGWGEASPFCLGNHSQSTAMLIEALQQVAPVLSNYHPLQRQEIAQVLQSYSIPSSAQAGIDMALHDWLGKQVNLPLWQLWGLNCDRTPPTSVTIGINSPEKAQERVIDWLKFVDVKVLKVKLGSTSGIEADKAMLLAVQEVAPNQELFVDANGGWSLEDAVTMCAWLKDLGIKYVEQPLPRGEENKLLELKKRSPLPIFVDESCMTSADIPLLANSIDGINIKLMKAGGLGEALRMVHAAKAYGLQVMFGCYSDSTLANTAAAHLSPLDDPFSGAIMQQGRLQLNNKPGLGVECRAVGK